jgi:potassium-transporting ATPase ATP-binding subunit
VHLKDIIKPGVRERFAELRAMGIRTVMITGDNPLTAAAIAAEAGVDDFLAEATPEAKLELIRKEQDGGGWWPCAATARTTRPRWRRPTWGWR